MTGKRGTAPCGHPGTHVTVNYVTCDSGCDTVNKQLASDISDGTPTIELDAVITKPLCAFCASANISVYPGFTWNGKDLYYCFDCHRTS